MNKLLINDKVCKNSGLVFLALIALLMGALTVHAQQYMTEVSSKTTGNVLYSADQQVWIRFKATDAVGMSVTQYGQPGFLKYVSRTADKVTAEGQEITVTYKCVLPMAGLPFKVGLVKNGQLVQEITKQVTCSSLPLESASTLQELSSDVTGTVGDTDTVSITARASNANGMSITQYGQPGYLSYISRTAASITSNNQDVKVTYKCVAPGTNIQFRMGIVQNGQIAKQITKAVTCSGGGNIKIGNTYLEERSGDYSGTVGDTDTISITARAVGAKTLSISQYGEPGYLSYVSRSASTVTQDGQIITVTYKCVAAGTNIPFELSLLNNGRQKVVKLSKKVSCKSNNARLQWMSQDDAGTVGSDSDTVYITAAALDAQGSKISQYGQPGYLAYVSRTTGDITTNYQSVTIKYKCVAVGSNILLTIQLVKNGQLLSQITKPVTCKGIIGNTYLQEKSSDVSGTVGGIDTVSIKATAVGARTLAVGQYGQPGILQYVSRNPATITQDSQDVQVIYKCVSAGTGILELYLVNNGQKAVRIAKTVTCKSA